MAVTLGVYTSIPHLVPLKDSQKSILSIEELETRHPKHFSRPELAPWHGIQTCRMKNNRQELLSSTFLMCLRLVETLCLLTVLRHITD
jgi:hypothetical protein